MSGSGSRSSTRPRSPNCKSFWDDEHPPRVLLRAGKRCDEPIDGLDEVLPGPRRRATATAGISADVMWEGIPEGCVKADEADAAPGGLRRDGAQPRRRGYRSGSSGSSRRGCRSRTVMHAWSSGPRRSRTASAVPGLAAERVRRRRHGARPRASPPHTATLTDDGRVARRGRPSPSGSRAGRWRRRRHRVAPTAVTTAHAAERGGAMLRGRRSASRPARRLDLNGSLHSTVRWAWSLSFRCTQSTV